MAMYSIKMRASQKNEGVERHISGAEKIIKDENLEKCLNQLLQRALNHGKGSPDFINMKIEKVEENEIKKLKALSVRTCQVDTWEEGRRKMKHMIEESGIKRAEEIIGRFAQTYEMRGAMLLDVDTLERLEPDKDRGIRATYMDITEGETDDRTEKNHFKEALVLATKVANHPNIVGELCISDDPDYITGYFASKDMGYVRITKLKEMGSADGGRIFLYRGDRKNVSDCIRYLEKQKVLVSMER